MQKPVFLQAMERRALPSGAWVDVKPNMTIDAELSLENKNELISAWVRNKTAAGGEQIEVAWDWEQTLWTERNRQRWVPEFLAASQASWSETQIIKCEGEETNFETGTSWSTGHAPLHWSPPPGSAWRKERPGNGESLGKEH